MTSNRKRSLAKPLLLVFAGIVVIALISRMQWVGYLGIIIFAAFALTTRLPTSRTFQLAIFSLCGVTVAILTGAWRAAENFAAYSFFLLILGTLQATVDIKHELRRKVDAPAHSGERRVKKGKNQ